MSGNGAVFFQLINFNDFFFNNRLFQHVQLKFHFFSKPVDASCAGVSYSVLSTPSQEDDELSFTIYSMPLTHITDVASIQYANQTKRATFLCVTFTSLDEPQKEKEK